MSSLPVSDLASISRFVRTLRDSAATHQAYKATLRGFLRFVRAHSGDGPLSTPLLRLWLKGRARQSPLRTVHAYACHVDRFLQWRQDCGEIPRNPFTELRRCYGLRAVGPMVDALLMKDYRGALEKHQTNDSGGDGAKRRSTLPFVRVRIPRDGEQCFHGIVNTDSTAT
jgi:hypothetical protein